MTGMKKHGPVGSLRGAEIPLTLGIVVPTNRIRTVIALRSVICAARKYRYERVVKLHVGT